jgi:hypothetical protein
VTIVVHRPYDVVVLTRKISILADGQCVARIGVRKSVALSLPPWQHQLQAKLDWRRSEVLHLVESPDARTVVVVRFPAWWTANWRFIRRPKTSILLTVE